MSQLIFVEQKPQEGREHQPQPGATIGREGCDINIADPEISRRHAAIRSLDDGSVAIEDLGSTNGTFVNGERITGTRALGEGDEVRFGATVWRLQAPAGATAVGEAQPAAAAPQATAVGQVPPDSPAAPAEERPPAPAPPAPDPAVAAAAGERRGDVPQPDFAPSAIRRVIPDPGSVPAAFQPAPARVKGSAATRLPATVFATVVTFLTAVGVVLYYIVEPFKP